MAPPQIRRLACLLLGAIAVWLIHGWAYFVGFEGEPIWFLEPARSFAQGQGLAVNMAWPAMVASLPSNFTFPVKLLSQGPLAPLLIGLGYKMFGLSIWVPLFFGFACTLLTGLLVYRLGLLINGERTALLSAAFFYTNCTLIESVYTASCDAPFILLLTTAVLCLWESPRRKSPRAWVAAAGLAVGIASCTRLAAQSYWPSFLVLVFWLRRGQLKDLAAFLTALLIPLGILAAYNHAVGGVYFYSPGFAILNWSPSFPGFRAKTMFMNMTSFQVLTTYPMDFLQKMVTGPAYAISRFLENAFNPYFMACAFFGMFTNFGRGGDGQKFRALAWIIVLPVFLFNAVFSYGAIRYLDPILPFLALAAAMFFLKFISENWGFLGKKLFLATPLFALLFLSPLSLRIKDHWKSKPQRSALFQEGVAAGELLKSQTRPGEIIYSDDTSLVAWQGARAVVGLTATAADTEKTFARMPPDAIVLTSRGIDSEDYDDSWRDAFYRGKPILGFSVCAEFRGKLSSAVLLKRPADCRPILPAKS